MADAGDSIVHVNDIGGTTASVDVSVITRNDGTQVVRERGVIAGSGREPDSASALADVRGEAGRGSLQTSDDETIRVLRAIAMSLERIQFLLEAAIG